MPYWIISRLWFFLNVFWYFFSKVLLVFYCHFISFNPLLKQLGFIHLDNDRHFLGFWKGGHLNILWEPLSNIYRGAQTLKWARLISLKIQLVLYRQQKSDILTKERRACTKAPLFQCTKCPECKTAARTKGRGLFQQNNNVLIFLWALG